jgi:dipeptidyl aminopeptidase/acylaminoacyl peptidase
MDSQTLISTASIPPEFLKATFMVGHIPFKALATDPRISYKLYIPSEHYNPNPKDPTHKLPLLPLVVGIHGTGRNASDVVSRLVPFAHSSHFAVLAPFFPAGLDGPNDLDSYKVLSSKTLRSDLALLSILE